MESTPYTLAKWQVRPGNESEFVAAWQQLAQAFAQLPDPPLWGSLLRSDTDPALFYSFGPWRRPDDIAAMRADSGALAALEALKKLCVDASPASYRLVAHVDLTGRAEGA